MINKVKAYNKERLKLLKRGRLKFLENQLLLQKKQGASERDIHQTMKDISSVRSELKNL